MMVMYISRYVIIHVSPSTLLPIILYKNNKFENMT